MIVLNCTQGSAEWLSAADRQALRKMADSL